MIRYYSKLTLNIFFLMGILSLTVSGVLVYNLYQKAYDANAEIVTTYQTIRAANRALLSIDEAAMDVSAFLITNDANYLKHIAGNIISTKVNVDTLKQLVGDNETEKQIFNKLEPLFNKKIQYLQQVASLYSAGNQAGALKLAGDKSRLELTSNIQLMIILIKKFENGKLERASPTYLQFKYEADKYFIILGGINILWLLFVYTLFRKYFDRSWA